MSRLEHERSSAVEPVDPKRLALAIHEAGHAVATVLLGHRIEGLTIGLDEGLSGCSFWGADPLPQSALNSCGRIFFLDWRVRKRLEDDLALTLAAHVAVAVWAPFESGYRPEPAFASECERLARELEQSRFAEHVEQRNAEPPLERQATRRRSQNSVASDQAARGRRPRFSAGCSPRFAIGFPHRGFHGRSPRSRAHYCNTPTCREPRYIGS